MPSFGLAASAGLLLGVGLIALDASPARTNARTNARAVTAESAAHAGGALRLIVAPEHNEARYFVREQLARINFPSDAVGVTDGVTGSLVLDDKGQVVPAQSKFVVDVTKLRSDREMRDGYMQHRTLETDKYPTVTLVPKQLRGVPTPLPDSGSVTFTLLGDLTVRGVTRLTTWMVTAFLRRGEVRGTASTGFTFGDFQIDKPRVGSVLSVADSIHLVYDFDLRPASADLPAAR